MKKALFILCSLIAALLFNACKSSQPAAAADPYSADDIAYVYFYSKSKCVGKQVNIVIDDYTKLDAVPAKSKKNAEAKGVAVGKRHVVVTCEGKVVYDNMLYVKTGSKKYVKLP